MPGKRALPFLCFSKESGLPVSKLPLSECLKNPNHRCCSKKYRNTPPICITIRLQCSIAVLSVSLRSEEREILSVLLPFVSQYASHLYCNTLLICIAVPLGKSWWLWSPGCSPFLGGSCGKSRSRHALGTNHRRNLTSSLVLGNPKYPFIFGVDPPFLKRVKSDTF